ncbi:MAG: sulfatase [Pirellulaceae bacterium]|jgi:arylsulfatase A-like enzyme
MNRWSLALTIAIGFLLSDRMVYSSMPGPMNVVLFLVDDLGQRDLSCYGSTFHETPNLDRLASQGNRFTDAYAACPVCSPTRASLMTGQWPQRLGITDFIGAPLLPSAWKRNTRLLPASYHDRLPLDSITIAEMFRQGGYATFFAGKWHLGPEGWWPENQGFQQNLGGTGQGGPYGGNKYFSPYENPRLPDGPVGEHLPDRLATETTKFIESHRDQPFFACFSFYSVHTPLMARADLQRKYEQKRERLGLQAAWGVEGEREVRLVQNHAIYAAMVEAMDSAVGKVLEKLDDLGIADRTLVLFTSDNGGLSTSEGWPTANAPLRAGKGWLYEGGIRVPLLVRWPGASTAGRSISYPVATPDLFPTMLQAAGIRPPLEQPVDGISLLPAILGHPMADRSLFWHYPHYGNQGGAPGAAIRKGDWKLIHWYEEDRDELFRLSDDIGEMNDLADSHADVRLQLRDELARWQKDLSVAYPTVNPAFDPDRPSGRFAKRPSAP